MPRTARAPQKKTILTTTTKNKYFKIEQRPELLVQTMALSGPARIWKRPAPQSLSSDSPWHPPALESHKKGQVYRYVLSESLLAHFTWTAAPRTQSSHLSQSTQVLGGVVWIKVPAPPAELITFCLCGNVLNLKSINSSS